jgi:hypothetical protein
MAIDYIAEAPEFTMDFLCTDVDVVLTGLLDVFEWELVVELFDSCLEKSECTCRGVGWKGVVGKTGNPAKFKLKLLWDCGRCISRCKTRTHLT